MSMIELRLIVSLTEKQKAKIIGRGEEIPYSPMIFQIERSHATTLARMNGKIEVTNNQISATTGGLGNQLHIPNHFNLGDEIAEMMGDGDMIEGATINFLMLKAEKILDEIGKEEIA